MTNLHIYTVAEVADYVRATLDRDSVLRDVWVSGEVSNFVASASGHCYFTMKEQGAAMRCVLFKGNQGAKNLANGNQVNAHGRVSFYPARGDTQLYVDAVVPAGAGALAAEFERLRAQLEAEGLFDTARKRPLPAFPKRIGVVTSEHGAVIHDICNVLGKRFPLVEVVLCPAAVQGDEAPGEVVEAIWTLNARDDIDVLIVGRGGGSLEDLWAFNTELVARAIYGSRVPVISAVGHESDFTIADFVADLRAPTPSAAAAAASPDVVALASDVTAMGRRAAMAAAHGLAERQRAVDAMVQRMQGRVPDFPVLRQRIDDTLDRGLKALTAHLRYQVAQTNSLEGALAALNPARVLARGYAAVARADTGLAVVSVGSVRPGDRIRATLHDGSFESTVTSAQDGAVTQPPPMIAAPAPAPTPPREERPRPHRRTPPQARTDGEGHQPTLF